MADPPRRSTGSRGSSFREPQVVPVSQRSSSNGRRAFSGPFPIARGAAAESSSGEFIELCTHPRPSLENPKLRAASSARSSSLSRAIELAVAAEVAQREITLDPEELLPDAPGEWGDKSLGVQMLKRNHSVLLSKRRSSSHFSRNQSVTGSSRFYDQLRAVTDAPAPPPPVSLEGPRHRYHQAWDYGDETGELREPGHESGGNFLREETPEYFSALTNAPQATLIHLVRLYHQTLVKHGLDGEAQKIADVLEELELAEEEEMDVELTSLDLLLKNGLLKYLMRIQPYLVPIPGQVIKFKNVNVTASVEIDPGYESIHTKVVECAKGPFKKSNLQKVQLVKNVTGYVMPGTLTLVLGPPGSGKNIFPTLLAGRGSLRGNIVEGSITYNGKDVNSINHQRLVTVLEPQDSHYASLTVRETLAFARECTQILKPQNIEGELREIIGEALKAGQDPKMDTNLSMLGLKRVAEKRIGNAMMPTLTANEVHRVSVAEMMAGTYAVYIYDHLNSGIDDGLAFDLVTAIRVFTRVRETSVIATLVQPSPEVVELFDRIILLNHGFVVYQGPRQDALPYFENLGYIKPKHVSIAEFLEEVTTEDGLQYLRPGFPRLDLSAFEAAYKNSDSYKDICRIVDSPELLQDYWMQGSQPLGVDFVRTDKGDEASATIVACLDEKRGSLVEPSMNHTGAIQPGDELVAAGRIKGMMEYVKVDPSKLDNLIDEPEETVRLQFERPHRDWEAKVQEPQFQRSYVQDWWPEFVLLLKRELTVTWRNKLGLFIRALQVLILGLLIGFLFLRVDRGADQLDMALFRGVTFVSLLDMTLFSLTQLPSLFQERGIYYKQQSAHFYRPSSYLAAKVFGSLPFSLAEATAWTLIVYFLTNLAVSEGGWHFWVFYGVIILTVMHGTAMVRCLSALMPDPAAASGILGLLVAIFILFAGYLVPRGIVPKYWIWAYYLDPLQHGITALVINEFNSNSYKKPCRDADLTKLPQCTGRPNETIGQAFLTASEFYTEKKWIAIAAATIIGWILLWTFINYLALAKVRHFPRLVIPPVGAAKYRRYGEAQDLEMASDFPKVKLSLPVVPVTLSWHELSYDILIPAIRKEISILHYVSGWAAPGELVGLLGSIGAGKTTLLNCLAGRKVTLGRIGGQVLVNGYPRVQSAFTRVVGYVDQLEAFSLYMTVREVVIFNTLLQLERTTTRQQRSEFVDEILELMSLKQVENNLVKSLGSSYLTYSEATRVNIAAELGRNPSILFLDEPFGRLDSTSSLHLIKTMKNIADTGRSVICAVATPSQRILGHFTSVQILKRGGELVYFGPVGKDSEFVKAYFEAIPGTPVCPPNKSIATYALDVIGDGTSDRKAPKDYAFEYRTNDLALYNHIQLQRVKRSKGKIGPQLVDATRGSSMLTSAKCIFTKLQIYYWRNLPYSWGRIISSAATAVLLGSVYFNIDYHTSLKMNVRAGSLFIATLLLAMSNIQAVLPQFLIQRQNYLGEKARNQYNLVFYGISWSIGEFQYLGVATLINSAIFCVMVQMAVDSAADFFRYWFVAFLLTLSLTYMGMFIASVSVFPPIAGVLVTIVIGAWTATSGVVIPKKKIPPQGVWIFWTNPVQYALNSLTSIAFYCDVDEAQCLNGGLNPTCANTPSACPQCSCTRLTDAGNVFVWTRLKFNRTLNYDRVGIDMLALLGFAILFRALTIICWRWRDARANKKNRL